jgi:predicted metal-dependent peptidase
MVNSFLLEIKIGKPGPIVLPEEFMRRSEESLYRQFTEQGIPDTLIDVGTGGPRLRDMFWLPEPETSSRNQVLTFPQAFAIGLQGAVLSAVDVAAGNADRLVNPTQSRTIAARARLWFMSSYPLLGALATNFKLIEDAKLCQRLDISIAAIDEELQEIYINPDAGLSELEARFVIAHELLHAGLRHSARRQGRDPFLWNVSCDYVINQWLIEMGIGSIPHMGLLHDTELKGFSAEAIYDLLITDLRRARKLRTFRGIGSCDILGNRPPEWWLNGDGMSLDDFYRRALAQGLDYYRTQAGRGLIPAGLIEEIAALMQLPIPWDIELARWFDAYFPPLERIRSYYRPSRRQSATPDIPRPRYVNLGDPEDARTFGVVLDTSGSMETKSLAKALGTIASYAATREVPGVRVVFCDAMAYDAGYMPVEAIAGRVQLKGRGGTILQPGIDLLEHAENFPREAPILIITDGMCDRLTIRYEHAFLMPRGWDLPFSPRGPVFRMREV